MPHEKQRTAGGLFVYRPVAEVRQLFAQSRIGGNSPDEYSKLVATAQLNIWSLRDSDVSSAKKNSALTPFCPLLYYHEGKSTPFPTTHTTAPYHHQDTSTMFSSVQATQAAEDHNATFTGWAAVPNGKGVLQKWSYHPRPLVEDEIEIEISHCGICGSDIHFSTEGWGPITRPAIPGHEIVGHVVARGEKAIHQIGDRVGVGCIVAACRGKLCDQCEKGEDQFCDQKAITFNAPYKDGRGGVSEGGFADRIRVYSDYAFKSKQSQLFSLCFVLPFCFYLFFQSLRKKKGLY